MIQVIVKDGKRQDRTLQISGFMKPSGQVVASVLNDRGEKYFVTIRHGHVSCTRFVNGKRENCLGYERAGHCYHGDAVLREFLNLPKYEELIGYAQPSEMETVQQFACEETSYHSYEWTLSESIETVYDELATSKVTVAAQIKAKIVLPLFLYQVNWLVLEKTPVLGACSHIVKLRDAGQECGACRCKKYS